MQQVETITGNEAPARRIPTHRLWIVEDRDGAAHWTSLTGLWPSRKGALTGQLDPNTKVPSGARLVITVAKSRNEVVSSQ